MSECVSTVSKQVSWYINALLVVDLRRVNQLEKLGLRKLLNLSSFVILVLSGPSLLVLNRPYWALLGLILQLHTD